MKRDNWTNEEIIQILRQGLFEKSDFESKIDHRFMESWNASHEALIETFEEFMIPEDQSGAMAYNEETGRIEHIGPFLPA